MQLEFIIIPTWIFLLFYIYLSLFFRWRASGYAIYCWAVSQKLYIRNTSGVSDALLYLRALARCLSGYMGCMCICAAQTYCYHFDLWKRQYIYLYTIYKTGAWQIIDSGGGGRIPKRGERKISLYTPHPNLTAQSTYRATRSAQKIAQSLRFSFFFDSNILRERERKNFYIKKIIYLIGWFFILYVLWLFQVEACQFGDWNKKKYYH